MGDGIRTGGEVVHLEVSSGATVAGVAFNMYRPDGTPRALKAQETIQITDVFYGVNTAGLVSITNGSVNSFGKRLIRGTAAVGAAYPNLTTPMFCNPGIIPYFWAPNGIADCQLQGMIQKGAIGSVIQPWMGTYEKFMLSLLPKLYFPMNELSGMYAGDVTNRSVLNAGVQTIGYGAASLITKSGGNSVLCNGTTDYFTEDLSVATALAAVPMSLSVWCKTTSLAGSNRVLSSTDGVANHFGPLIALRPAGGDLWLGHSDLSTNRIVTGGVGAIAVNNVYNIAMSYDGTTITGYLNGRKIGTVASANQVGVWNGGSGNSIANLGGSGGSEYLVGNVQDLAIFSRVLTDAEFASIYSQGVLGV